jgi:hypothetical protein
LKNIPLELESLAPNWFRYLTRVADFTKMKTAPNEKIDMNDFRYCIVGECLGGQYTKYSPAHDNHCAICFKLSYRLSEEYHMLINNGGDTLHKFNAELMKFINHFKSVHSNK